MTVAIRRPVMLFADTVDGGRAKLGVAFSEEPPAYVVDELCHCLGSEFEAFDNYRMYKWYCPSNHVSQTKMVNALMALHNAGYERHDDLYSDRENADECFGCRNPNHHNYVPRR